jgi:ribonuclease HI
MINYLKNLNDFVYRKFFLKPNYSTAKQIKRIIELNSNTKFSDFAKLKSGYDRFSDLTLANLQKISPSEISNTVKAYMYDEYWQAKALRWYLRGLPINLAIKKILVDQEISLNAMSKNK